MIELIQLVGIVLNFIMFIYIIYTIPSRVKQANNKLDTVTKNQTIIEKLIKKLGGVK